VTTIAAATVWMTISETTAGTVAPGSLMTSSARSGIHDRTSATIEANVDAIRVAEESAHQRVSDARENDPARGVGRDRSLERLEVRRHRECLPRSRFNRKINRYCDDQRD